MEIDISGRHFQVSAGLKEHVNGKILRLDKFSLKLEAVHVVLEVQKFNHISEITAMGKNLRFTAKETDGDMYAAFDKSFGNIQLQLQRQHDRVKDHKARRYAVEPSQTEEDD